MRITLNFDEDPQLKDSLREKLLEALGGLARGEINQNIDKIIQSKINTPQLIKHIDDAINKFLRDRITAYFNQNRYSYDTELTRFTDTAIRESIQRVLESKEMSNTIESLIKKLVNERMDSILTAAISNSFGEKKFSLKLE
jgi:hypothetical protein